MHNQGVAESRQVARQLDRDALLEFDLVVVDVRRSSERDDDGLWVHVATPESGVRRRNRQYDIVLIAKEATLDFRIDANFQLRLPVSVVDARFYIEIGISPTSKVAIVIGVCDG